jgi:hypothetical protein
MRLLLFFFNIPHSNTLHLNNRHIVPRLNRLRGHRSGSMRMMITCSSTNHVRSNAKGETIFLVTRLFF